MMTGNPDVRRDAEGVGLLRPVVGRGQGGLVLLNRRTRRQSRQEGAQQDCPPLRIFFGRAPEAVLREDADAVCAYVRV